MLSVDDLWCHKTKVLQSVSTPAYLCLSVMKMQIVFITLVLL